MTMPLEAGALRVANSADEDHKELIRQERAIARKYIGKFPLAMAIWGLGNLVCWLALWPLVFTGKLPLWAAFPIAAVKSSYVTSPGMRPSIRTSADPETACGGSMS